VEELYKRQDTYIDAESIQVMIEASKGQTSINISERCHHPDQAVANILDHEYHYTNLPWHKYALHK
jgi:hypothetical protein